MKSRSPVVVVLGHVDHGKTSLLDYIRKSNKAEKEVGGITQSIGAYEVDLKVKGYETNKITFIDTPGHEAFTKLRLRGADVADIAILIIDAVDSVMPQTKESIFHIKNANIPYVVAVNKIDLPGANIDKVKKDLLKEEVLVEGMGGDIPVVGISAKTGTGVNELLEMILMISSLEEYKYSESNPVKAYTIESKLDKSGPTVSVIIKDGMLKVGDTVYSGDRMAKIKALISDSGVRLDSVYPSTPFVLLGFKELPEVGVSITKEAVGTDKISEKIQMKQVNANDFFEKVEKKKLKIIIKAESQGSLEALLYSLAKNDNIEVVLSGVGDVNKSDIYLANISKAIVIGFAVNVDRNTQELADQEKVVIKSYKLIYDLIDELFEVSNLLAEKEDKEKSVKGEAKVLARFMIEKEIIAGIKVNKGKLNLDDTVEIYRNDKLFIKTKIVSLKHRAKSVTEIKKNEEGGVIFYPQFDFVNGDVIKSYSI